MSGPNPAPGTSETPAASANEAQKLRRETLARSIRLNTELESATAERKALLANQISENTKEIRKQSLRYNENPYEDGRFFDYTGCEDLIIHFGSREQLVRSFFHHLSVYDVDSHDSVDIDITKFNPLKLLDQINAYNTAFRTSTHIVGTQKVFDCTTLITDAAKNYVIPDYYTGDCQHINYNIEQVFNETIGKIELADREHGEFFTLGSGDENSPGQRFLNYMIYSIQKKDDINSAVGYIAPDGLKYFVKLNKRNEITHCFLTSNAMGTGSFAWNSNIPEVITNSYQHYLNQGSQSEKINEIKAFILNNQEEVTLAQSNQELGQPEFEADGSEHVSQSTQEQAVPAPRALTPSQIRERIAILHEKEKANPSRLLSILTFIGIDKNLLFGALAMDASIPNNELDFTITSVMGAMFTVVLRRSSLPSFITGDSENGESSPNQPVEAPNTQVNPTPEVLSKSNNRNQNSIHSKKSTTFTIPDNFVVSNNEAIYLAPGTKITLQRGQEIKFYNNIAGGTGNRIGDSDLDVNNGSTAQDSNNSSREATQTGQVITVNKPCLILNESIEGGRLGRNITIQGHAQYSLKENFTNFNFN